jgi:hypothetical protein
LGVVEGRRVLLALAMLGMGMASFRGILMCSSLALADLMWAWLQGNRHVAWHRLWPYLLMAAATLVWLKGHQEAVGWMFSPPAATYGGHRQFAGMGGILHNLGILSWRLLDHGRIVLWLAAVYLGWRMWRRGPLENDALALGGFAAAPILSIGLLFVLFTNPIGHRYFIAVYALLGLFVLRALWCTERGSWPKTWTLVIGLGLFSGHAWVYPDTVAKGWDATLAHLPYHRLRLEAVQWLDQQGIGRHDVCTDFPAIAAEAYLDPAQSDTLPFRSKEAGLQDCAYVLYTNVSNGFSDVELADFEVAEKWEVLWQGGTWPVRVRVLRQRDKSLSSIPHNPYF